MLPVLRDLWVEDGSDDLETLEPHSVLLIIIFLIIIFLIIIIDKGMEKLNVLKLQ